MGFLTKWIWRLHFRSMNNRILRLGNKLRNHPFPEVRKYHSRVSPEILRYERMLQKVLALPKYQRVKCLIHLMSQYVHLQEDTGNWSELLPPELNHEVSHFKGMMEVQKGKAVWLVIDLVDLLNYRCGSSYVPAYFLKQPPSPGVEMIQKIRQEILEDAQILKSQQALEPLKISNFEAERLSMRTMIDFSISLSPTPFVELATKMVGAEFYPVSGPVEVIREQTVQAGLSTVRAMFLMLETAYERSK